MKDNIFWFPIVTMTICDVTSTVCFGSAYLLHLGFMSLSFEYSYSKLVLFFFKISNLCLLFHFWTPVYMRVQSIQGIHKCNLKDAHSISVSGLEISVHISAEANDVVQHWFSSEHRSSTASGENSTVLERDTSQIWSILKISYDALKLNYLDLLQGHINNFSILSSTVAIKGLKDCRI